MGTFLRRVLALFRRGRLERDLDDELAFHLAMREQDQRRSGLAPAHASHAARRQFGNPTLLRERARDAWVFGPLERLAQDVRFAMRDLRRSPGFTAVAVSTLALGVAATTTLFSVAYGVLLKPLPWTDADRLVRVTETRAGRVGRVRGTVMNSTFAAWTEAPLTIEALGGWLRVQQATMLGTGSGEPARVATVQVTPNLFRLLGVQPAIGRPFADGEGRQDIPPVALLSHGLWQERFGGQPSVLGKPILLDERAHTVVGVMPPDFAFPVADVAALVGARRSATKARASRANGRLGGRPRAGTAAQRRAKSR